MEHADRFLRRFYIEKGMFGSLSVTFIFYRPPLRSKMMLGLLVLVVVVVVVVVSTPHTDAN